jgi:hypothetical protein
MSNDYEKKESEMKNSEVIEEPKLDKAYGGYTFNAAPWAGVRDKPCEVIDDGNGDVLGRYATMDEATEMAGKKGQSTKEIKNWDELYKLRSRDGK